MLRLAERQAEFAAALLDSERPAPSGLIGPDGTPSARRFAVYRNNVVVGLIDMLQAAFPAVRRIVGEEFFRAMARVYVAQQPPNSPIMLGYGSGFPDFIGGFEPAATLPYLADVARIERAWSEAYHAAEAEPLDPAVLAAVESEERAKVRLLLHPSVRITRSRFPALTIWQMNVGDGVPAPVDPDADGEDAILIRPEAEVEVRSLPKGGAAFIGALLDGGSVLEATKAALTADSRFDLSANLTGLLQTGAIVGFETQVLGRRA
ncbi:MAG: putative DNA-binding domain-containing protein [Bradyrhizobium sp.]|uniref:HvfC/BufC N-terminal domain-containing protein n=1 Tax=Bradyrhizobium sp. TaxID=376 RepID=UPI00239F100D|nr:DNA-binding domain-containing protein [Bradyrhizobium sp.]MDE2601941.1 putative DNA-binding domain-containing protein [Bradyrhizobium sp.]